MEVGVPIPGFSVRITDEKGGIVEEGVIGHVQGKGPMICNGYYQNPKLNREIITKDGWLKTGDLGFLKNGRLTVTGRAKDIIIVNGQNYSCREIEAAVEKIEGVRASYTFACGIRGASVNTDQLFIVFRPLDSGTNGLDPLIQAIHKQVMQKFGIEPGYILPADKESVGKTWTGKINRSEFIHRFLTKGEIDEGKVGRICSTYFAMAQSSIGANQKFSQVENEQIDLIGRTAFNVAAWREEETEGASPLFFDHMANIFLDEEMRKTARRIGQISPSTKYLVNARVKYFDNGLSDQLKQGVDQVILLGAGLDTRAIRLGTNAAQFFEVDKEATFSFKSNRLQSYRYCVQSTFVPCDYTKADFIPLLIEHGFDCSKETYCIWEGNTMYLSYKSVRSVLRSLEKHVQKFVISFDYLSSRLLDEPNNDKQKMDVVGVFEQLGAPFVTGFDDIYQLAKEVNYTVKDNILLIDFMNQNYPECQLGTHLFRDYSVCTLTPK